MSKTVVLDAGRLGNKEDMSAYMKEIFDLPEHFGKNLDALNDVLSEVNQETEILLTRENIDAICKQKYAYKVLMVLGRAADENPDIKIRFAEEDENK